MNEIQVFNFNNQTVRTVSINNDTYWVLKDVCDVLGISNSRMTAERLDGDEVSQTDIIDSLGRKQLATVINESGLYSVILRSDKPNAKEFRKWVTSEVLPSIRKTGTYSYEVPKNFKEALLLAVRQQEELEEKQRLLDIQRPKVELANSFLDSEDTILIGNLAKLLQQNGIETGQKRLFQWLRDNKYLGSYGNNYNVPTQRAMELGLFKIKEVPLEKSYGTVLSFTTLVTTKGQRYFLNKFLKMKEEGN